MASLNCDKDLFKSLPTKRRSHNDSASARIGCHPCATQRNSEIGIVSTYRPLNLCFLIGGVVSRAPQFQLSCKPIFRKHHVAEIFDSLTDGNMERAGTK